MNRVSRAVLLSFVALAFASCASRLIAVRALDDAILDFQQSQFKALCHGANLAKDPSAEIFAKSTYNISLGAPAGATPIAISGGAGLEESSKITIKYDFTKQLMTLKPGSPQCKQLLAPPSAGSIAVFNTATDKVEERPVSTKILIYDKDKGLVTEEPVGRSR